METGKLVVFEGLDGCGKTTQAELLVSALVKSGKKARLIHFPAYTSKTGKLIAKHLRGESKVAPPQMALLYATDKYEQEGTLVSLLDEGFNVVVDRYTASNCAYQSARLEAPGKSGDRQRRDFMEWILQIEDSLPKPDATIFLDVDPAVSFRLNLEKRGRKYLNGEKDAYERDLKFQKKVREQYLALSKIYPLSVIKASEKGKMLSKETTRKKVVHALRRAKALPKGVRL